MPRATGHRLCRQPHCLRRSDATASDAQPERLVPALVHAGRPIRLLPVAVARYRLPALVPALANALGRSDYLLRNKLCTRQGHRRGDYGRSCVPVAGTICNTLQNKKTRVLSNGIGMSNIMAKYQMLGQSAPSVRETNDEFVVTLPLIGAGE